MILQMSFRRLVLIGFLMVSVSLSFLALGFAGPAQATASNPVLAQQDDDDGDDDDGDDDNGTAPVGGVQTGGGGTSIVLAQEDDDDDDDGDDDNGGAPVGGVQTGGGGTASSGTNTLPFALGGGALMAAIGGFVLKRRLARG